MSENKTGIKTSPSALDIKKVIQDVNNASSSIQSLIDRPEGMANEPAGSIPSMLTQVQQTLFTAGSMLHTVEATQNEAQQITQSVDELQTLLDVLPIGIVVAHDPQNQNMTINPAGLKMLNLPPGSNPSKSAPGGDSLPFKVLRGGHEIPTEELPMQRAARYGVISQDVELDIQHSNGKVINLLVYASPLFDERGIVRGSLGILVDITVRKSIEQRLAMQHKIARVLAEASSINKAATQVLQLICETAGWEYGALWRVEPDQQTLTNEGVWHADSINLSEHAEKIRYSVINGSDTSMPGHVLQSGQPLWLSNLAEFHAEDAEEAENVGLCSAFILPVRNRERVVAILECLSNRNQIEDQNLNAMLSAVGNQIGIFVERKQLEEALANRAIQLRLLAQAGIALSTTLDYKQRLETLVHIIVPDLADWCAIDIIDRDQVVQRVAAAHVDPSMERLVYELQPSRPVNLNAANTPQFETLNTGQSMLYTDIPASLIEENVVDLHQLEIIRQLNPISAIVVPMITPNQNLGICTLVQSDSGRHYSSSDIDLAEDIGHRVALALDNSLLYEQSQKLNDELEHRVDVRTSQLKLVVNQLTTQIEERQHAEDQIKKLNAELEQRIAERTSQLEKANRKLKKEVLEHQRASETFRILLKRTRELYRISQTIGTVRTPNELLGLLLSSSYLKDVSRASIAILDKPWIKDEAPPDYCFILAEWNKGKRQPTFINQRFTLEEYGVSLNNPFGKPIVIQDIQSVVELPEKVKVRKRFAELHTHSLIILPLIAGGEFYGLLSLHFKTRQMSNMDDLNHVRGLVDEMALVIKNVRLLEAESQARKEAERANDLKLRFLGMISHELRTPLTSIKGFATTLLADDVVWTADKQHEFLETINNEADKLHDLIEQLLDLSRIEAGILRITPIKVSLSSIIDTALAQLQAITDDHKLVLAVPARLPSICGDELRIAQVLTNLVNNAVKFSPPHTQITISAHRVGKMVQVDVADQGPGIPEQETTRIFEAFRQLGNDTSSRTKGAGLGLAICKGLIEAHHGQIWIQNHEGSGTVVSFTIPIWIEIEK